MKVFEKVKWLLKKLGILKEEKKPLEKPVKPHYSSPHVWIPKHPKPRKIRGKFKPRTAFEKRLWKPNAKMEEEK